MGYFLATSFIDKQEPVTDFHQLYENHSGERCDYPGQDTEHGDKHCAFYHGLNGATVIACPDGAKRLSEPAVD